MISLEDIIKTKGSLVYHNKGTSMLPLIKEGRDLLVIESDPHPVRKYDVVLSKRYSGRYLLHRVVKVRNNGTYIIAGDNSWKSDIATKDSVIGIMTGLIRNGKPVNLSSLSHRLPIVVWCELFRIRMPILQILRVLKIMS